MKTVILTYIHTPFWGTQQFLKSTKRIGLPVHNAWDIALYTGKVGSIMYMQYVALLELQKKYTHVIYSDAADTIFLKAFQPEDGLLISAEKACFPDKLLAELYPNYPGPWKYVNAGNWCSSIEIAIKFFEKYGLNTYQDKHVNGQREWHHAFLNGCIERFPVRLDYSCNKFQTTAFEDQGDFYSDGISFKNFVTGTEPCVLHGNGRTDMTWIYENLNK